MQRAYERGIKQISMIDMTSKKAKKQESKQVAQTSMVSIASNGAEKGKGMHEAIGIMVMHPK